MTVIPAKNAAPILRGNGSRPVDCIILALEKNLRPAFFFFEPARGLCAIYGVMQGYLMYGYGKISLAVAFEDAIQRDATTTSLETTFTKDRATSALPSVPYSTE